MKELRKICEIITQTPSDTDSVLKVLENVDVLVRRFDAGSGRERFIVFEKIDDEKNDIVNTTVDKRWVF